jgi:hypothetical protein
VIHSRATLSQTSIESVFRFLCLFTPQCSLLPSSSPSWSALQMLKTATAVSRPSTQIALLASKPAHSRCCCSAMPPYFVATVERLTTVSLCCHCCACLIQDSLLKIPTCYQQVTSFAGRSKMRLVFFHKYRLWKLHCTRGSRCLHREVCGHMRRP